MTTAEAIYAMTQQVWRMARHTVCRLCDRYRPTNSDRVCRPCMERHVKYVLEDAANTRTEENE